MNSTEKDVLDLDPFYINILLLDTKAMVAEKVAERVGAGIFGRSLAAVASSVISDTIVGQQVATELIEKITTATDAIGITCTFEQSFQQGPFLTLKTRVMAIETIQLIIATKGDDYAAKFTRLLASLVDLGLSETALPKIRLRIVDMVQSKIMEKFAEKIPAALEERGILCQVDVVSSALQAEYFFKTLHELNKRVSK
jgi:hypothetical protein